MKAQKVEMRVYQLTEEANNIQNSLQNMNAQANQNIMPQNMNNQMNPQQNFQNPRNINLDNIEDYRYK